MFVLCLHLIEGNSFFEILIFIGPLHETGDKVLVCISDGKSFKGNPPIKDGICMVKHYSDLLKKNPSANNQMSLIGFDPSVVKKYSEQEGPWSLTINKPGSTDSVNFWTWQDEYPVLMIPVYFSMGRADSSAKGLRLALLKDLAGMPESEQEHWRKFEKPIP